MQPANSIFRVLLLNIIILFLAGCASAFGHKPAVQIFIQHVSHKDNFDEIKLTELFNQVHPRSSFIHKFTHPTEKVISWNHYQAIFITSKRINAGCQFWIAHQKALQLAQQRYGVDPAIIIGIIGVETEYGEFLGQYRVIDSLSTLGFENHNRSTYFQYELEQYLLLTRELNQNPLNVYGSYAGAMGLPQFMPSNYRTLAVSTTPPNRPNLNNPDDAILSVGHYFHHMGWYAHKRPAVPVQYYHRDDVLFGNQYWRLYHNFNVIKRYNNSNYYAMAVYQLGQAIQQAVIIKEKIKS